MSKISKNILLYQFSLRLVRLPVQISFFHFPLENTYPAFSSSSTNVSASIGEEARLPCRVNGPSKTEYWWEKNGDRLRKKKKYRTKRFRYLRIKKVEKSDAGDYVCWASYRGKDIHQTITLNVKGEIRVLIPFNE